MVGKRIRFVSAVLALLLISCLFVSCKSGGGEEEQAEVKKYIDDGLEGDNSGTKILYLGDSIAEGIIGPSPVIERERYAYPSVVGMINRFTYRNRAVSGHKSWELLRLISNEKDNSGFALITHIKTADVISISILGNDVLQDNLNGLMRQAMDDDYDYYDRLLERSYEAVTGIVARIKELNPDVTLIIQTVYNPVYVDSTLMNNGTKKYILSKGYEEKDFHAQADKVMNKLNGVLMRYLEEHPGAFHLLDVKTKFDELYNGVEDNLDRLIFHDCIHPSDEGHAVIAAMLQEKLEELGIADRTLALSNYKKLCASRLTDLYTGTTVNVEDTIRKMNASNDYYEITKIYFDDVDGVDPIYGSDKDTVTTADESFKIYSLDTLKAWNGTELSFLDMEESYLALNEEEKRYIIRLKIDDAVLAAIEFGLTVVANTYDAYISLFDFYVNGFFPTESLSNIASLKARLENDLGLYIEGLNLNSDNINNIVDSIQTKGKFPSGAKFPETLAFVVAGTYERKTVKSETGDDFDAIYCGDYARFGETYVVLTCLKGENGEDRILLVNDPLSLRGEFTEKTGEDDK